MLNLIKKIAIGFFILSVIFLFILSVLNYAYLEKELASQIVAYGIIAIFIFCIFLELIPTFISPHAIILLAFSLKLDLVITTMLVMTGSLLGSGLGYALGRYYGTDLIKNVINQKKLEKFRKDFSKMGKIYVAISAVSPLPYIPIVFGAIGIKKRTFLYYGLFFRMAGFIGLSILLYLI